MSHLIEQSIDTVYTPAGGQWQETWHGLETPVDGGIKSDGTNIPLVFCPIVECGVKPDFESPVSTVPAEAQAEIGMEAGNWKMILADCRNGKSKNVFPVHIPKKGYTIHQNKNLFDCMVSATKAVLGEDGFEIVTVGTLGAYSQFFISIAIKGNESFNVGVLDNGLKDTHKKFFNLNSSHNGLVGSNRSLSTVRQVCMNTVNMSIGQATENGTISAIKHTPGSVELITPAQFEADFKLWIANAESLQEMLLKLKEQKMDADKFKAFAAGVFTTGESEDLSVKSFNRVNDMVVMFQKGKGNRGKTRYDAVNAFTEYFTHGDGAGSAERVSLPKRIATANFGRANEWKLQAMQIATSPEAYAEAIKRGEKLYVNAEKALTEAENARVQRKAAKKK